MKQINNHVQLEYDGPVREEEQVCEAGSMHPNKDVRVMGHPDLLQEWHISATHTHTHKEKYPVRHAINQLSLNVTMEMRSRMTLSLTCTCNPPA